MVMDIFWENGLSESGFSFLRVITLGKLSSISTRAKCGSNRIQGKESLLRDWQALSSGPSCDLHISCGASPKSLWESSEITPAKLLAKIETGRASIQTQIFLRPKLLLRNSQGTQDVAPWWSFCFLVHSPGRLSPCCCVLPWVQGQWSGWVTWPGWEAVHVSGFASELLCEVLVSLSSLCRSQSRPTENPDS